VEDELVGNGGCVAHALFGAGVFGSTEEAVEKLNAAIDLVHELLVNANPVWTRERTGVEGVKWHPRVIARVCHEAGFHMRKYDPKALPDAIAVGGPYAYLIDGVLNSEYEDEGGETVETDPTDFDGPRPWQPGGFAHWRHAIALRNGLIVEQHQQTIEGGCLHIDPSTGAPDNRRGYFWSILKVYRIWPCSGEEGCRGTCSA